MSLSDDRKEVSDCIFGDWLYLGDHPQREYPTAKAIVRDALHLTMAFEKRTNYR